MLELSADLPWLLMLGVFAAALLYSSVGHAGASGYLAVMSLLSLAPTVMRPTALALNILVASIAAWQFYRAGHFRWGLFWPFAVLSVPLAYIGGNLQLTTRVLQILLGIVLLLSAVQLLLQLRSSDVSQPPSRPAALASGATIGLFSGLTGTGGGIFLTPLLLLMRWARAKEAAATSALFILVNSSAGMLGNWQSTRRLPDFIVPLLGVAALGGTLGAWIGSRRLPPRGLKTCLAIVLVIAGGKLLFTG
jgi:hypothetical protein